MKPISFRIAWIGFGALIFLYSCHSRPAPQPPPVARYGFCGKALAPDLPPGDQISAVLRTYANSLKEIDLASLRSVTTEHYRSHLGTEEQLRMKLEARQPRYIHSTVADIKMVQTSPNKIFARYSTIFANRAIDEMPDRWLVLIPDGDGWKIDDIDKKFDPLGCPL